MPSAQSRAATAAQQQDARERPHARPVRGPGRAWSPRGPSPGRAAPPGAPRGTHRRASQHAQQSPNQLRAMAARDDHGQRQVAGHDAVESPARGQAARRRPGRRSPNTRGSSRAGLWWRDASVACSARTMRAIAMEVATHRMTGPMSDPSAVVTNRAKPPRGRQRPPITSRAAPARALCASCVRFHRARRRTPAATKNPDATASAKTIGLPRKVTAQQVDGERHHGGRRAQSQGLDARRRASGGCTRPNVVGPDPNHPEIVRDGADILRTFQSVS